jgi:hypothetical protein
MAGVLRWVASVGAALLGMLPCGVAQAQSSEAFGVDYVARETCPAATAFVAKITTRTHRAHLASANERARILVVRVTPQGRRFLGRLTIRDPDGTEAERSLSAATCDEVVSGLALIAAVVLDPTALSETAAPQTSPPVVEPGTIHEEPAPADPPVTPEPSPERPPQPAAPVAKKPTAPADRNESETSRRWQIALGLHAEVARGLSPAPLASVPLFLEIARTPEGSVFAPAARIRFERAGSSSDISPAGGAHFTWTEASLDLCPIAWWPQPTLRAQACVRAEGGSVEAQAVNTTPARNDVRPWFMIGAPASGRWVVAGLFFLEIEAALLVPILRDRFFLRPDTTIFRAAPIAFSASAGAGVSIW